ncbi:MAG TPA: methyltransferase domain-containing protein [Actinomycetota bacterium]|nr:methyltransferase domain-containing protein [Actinomycetota bacterium]
MTDETRPEHYLWDNTLAEEKQRLDEQAAIWDPYTQRYIDKLGISAGWRCLEVGAGSGTMTAWLAERVAPGGSVVAGDIDTRFLAGLEHPAIETRQLDITSGEIEKDAFDLVYARMVLMHLPDSGKHLATMAAAVRPGGWLLVQDVDLGYLESRHSTNYTWPVSNRRFAVRTAKALNALLSMTGASTSSVREHPRRLFELGLEDIGAESVIRMEHGDPNGTFRKAYDRVKDYLVQYAGFPQEDAEQRLRQMDDPKFTFSTGPMVSAWGRRPVR